jgi:hypothetical protein
MSIINPIVSRVSGSDTSTSQVFACNTINSPTDIVQTTPQIFNVPNYSLVGATYAYYIQNADGISVNLNNIKTVEFNFSSNTSSLSSTTLMQHDIYRIPYDLYTSYIQASGTTSNSASTAMQQAISVPFYSIRENVSGDSFTILNTHQLVLPQQIKKLGGYSESFFLDKSQFFIDSTFVFPVSTDMTVGDVFVMSGGVETLLYGMPPSGTSYSQTSNNVSLVTGNTLFSGNSISGASFTWFSAPKRPDIFVINNQPSVIGSLATYSPIFSFNGVSDSDYYRLLVSYNTGDSTFSNSTKFDFPAQPGNDEYIRSVSVPLTPNSQFIYKIGGVKSIVNLFGTRQNVVSYSDYIQAETNSANNFNVTGHTWINYIGGNSATGVTLTLTIQVNNASVYLESDVVTDSNLNSTEIFPLGGQQGTQIIVTSDVNGYFHFDGIPAGSYTGVASYTGLNTIYFDQTFNFFLSSDLNMDVIFDIIWGNETIIFDDPYTFL